MVPFIYRVNHAPGVQIDHVMVVQISAIGLLWEKNSSLKSKELELLYLAPNNSGTLHIFCQS